MIRRRWLLAVVVVSLSVVTRPAAADISVITIPPAMAPERHVVAAATGAPGDGDSTSAGGVYSHTATSIGTSMAGLVETEAFHSSDIPDLVGSSMSGSGTSDVHVEATGFTGFSVLADSFFDVFFNVTVSDTYRLDGDVHWEGDAPAPFTGYARVQLMDVTNALVPFDVQRDSMLEGMASLGLDVPLSAGVAYRLRGESYIAGGFATAGIYDASAHWRFRLTIPEPTTAALFAIGLLVMPAIAARRRKR